MAEREERERLRVVFMGTPDFAAASLRHLLDWDGCDVVGVYCQPDRPCGRGQVCTPPPVKLLAMEHRLPVFQPLNFKQQPDVDQLAALAPDLLLVAAYGLILPNSVLDIPRLGAINVHASLLPEYRGAAPIHRAIVDGRHVTGITIMRMEAGLDTGDILLQRSRAIGINDTAQSLHDELADMGGRLLVEALEKMNQGRLVRIPQDHAKATYASKLSKEEGHIDWNQPVLTVHNRIRGLYPWPGSWFDWDGMPGKTLRLTVHPGVIGEPLPEGVRPGEIHGVAGDSVLIACADRLYAVPTIKPAGSKPLGGREFYCGYLSRCSGEHLLKPDLACPGD
ncbi:methionyl-tRNA formyltransferase [Desulfomicrobium escambiense]|uniref:methionyl-tRNA formyltransferase n=1 Tax=Desulfomicrobium escambiense TaxID=29503 RepID=UPI000427E14D|nr:methionyl-tRNA formyltransferase [Desulfomicrobium escambiense]